MTDLAFAAAVAPLDDRLSPVDRQVLSAIVACPDVTLDGLCRPIALPRPHVFYAVARLEDLGYLPMGAIR